MNNKKTQIIQFGPRRTMSDINQSINSLKKNILDLQAGTYSLTLATPPIVPDIQVSVLEDKVYARFLAHKDSVENLAKVLGVKMLEYIESALIDTYEQIQALQDKSGKAAHGLIQKVSAVSKTLFHDKPITTNSMSEKQAETKKKKKYPKHTLTDGEAVTLYEDQGEFGECAICIQVKIKNKVDKPRDVLHMLFNKNRDSTYSRVKEFTGNIAPSGRGTVQLVLPSDCKLTAVCSKPGIQVKVKSIKKHTP